MDGLIVDIVVEEEPLEDLNDEKLWSYRQLMLAKLRRIARGESRTGARCGPQEGVGIVRMQQTAEGFCCGHGFLKDEIQQKEDDC